MKLQLVNELRRLSKMISRKSPTVLTGIAVAGTIGSVFMMHYATKKAVVKMDDLRSKDDYEEPESKAEEIFEEVKETWSCYAPVAIIIVVTVVSEIQSNRINLKRLALVTDAYRMSENLRKEYQEKTKEIVGKGKEEKIRTELAKDEISKDSPKEDCIFDTGEGRIIFKDRFSGRYFYQDIEKMRKARNQLDSLIKRNDYAALNEWYYLIKLEPLDDVGSVFGWNLDRLDWKDLSGIDFVPSVTHNGIPCYLVTYQVELGYDRYEPS